MNITINAIESCMDIPNCMTAKNIKSVTLDEEHLSILSEYVLCGWASIRAEDQKDSWLYCSFRDENLI